MGAWPEREAPAEIFASVNITVEKGMDSSIPFSLRFEKIVSWLSLTFLLLQTNQVEHGVGGKTFYRRL